MKKTIIALSMLLLLVIPSLVSAKELSGTVTMQFDLKVPVDAKQVRLWIPYALSDKNQLVKNIKVAGNFASSAVYREGENGNVFLYAEWNGSLKARNMTYSFDVTRKELITKDFPRNELPFSREEFSEYLRATTYGPTTGKVKQLADRITKGKTSNLEKAKAIYDWIVSNMRRDPNVKGCGFGKVDQLLIDLGGKCGDIHSVFTALARSAGVPTRDLWGLRLARGKDQDITKFQHCWVEFYVPGYGWVVADPADVRRAMLIKNTNALEDVKDLVQYYFGSVDEIRLGYYTGKDITLNPQQSGKPINYIMYPYAEADGKQLNEDLYGFNIGYKIMFSEK
ncbi:MAG: transglutaminase [Syntrophus sp. (in: bacteria)]|nr:transglutaminase [Syntrophus sp. (in: bacteria)]